MLSHNFGEELLLLDINLTYITSASFFQDLENFYTKLTRAVVSRDIGLGVVSAP